MTNPNYRPPVDATVAGEPMSSSREITAERSEGASGSASSNSTKRETFSGTGATRRA